VALEASEAEVLPLLNEGVEIAGLNGPRSTVISGDEAAVLALAEQFKTKGRRTSRLQVSHAFHSKRMEPMLEAFRKVVSQVAFGTPLLPVVSNVTGRVASSEELCSAEYWVRQVRKPVRFVDGVHVLEAEGVRASLELGPDGILTALAAASLSEASQLQAVAAQRRGRLQGAGVRAAAHRGPPRIAGRRADDRRHRRSRRVVGRNRRPSRGPPTSRAIGRAFPKCKPITSVYAPNSMRISTICRSNYATWPSNTA